MTNGVRRRRSQRAAIAAAAFAALVALSLHALPEPSLARAACVASGALVLWLSELVPAHAVTLLLLGAIPLVLGGSGDEYRLGSVLRWAADPVLALFFGGFALGAAASRHGLDVWAAHAAMRGSRGDWRRMLALVMIVTAVGSMWMSNIAAAAMMFGALRSFLAHTAPAAPRRALLLGTAFAANFGGMATPIGTGPNAIAIAELSPRISVTFVEWMVFAFPLMLGMLLIGYGWLVHRHHVHGSFEVPAPSRAAPSSGARGVLLVSCAAVALWVTEPLHHVPAAVVSLLVVVALFASDLLGREDLGRIDWSTLILIAGGITLGRLMEHTGLIHAAMSALGLNAVAPTWRITAFVLVSATLSALMSNTATAVLLVPLAMAAVPAASTPVLIAIGASFGIPFTISTPPNAMAYGEGGITTRDLLELGLPVMLLGGLLVGLTGPSVLALVGLR